MGSGHSARTRGPTLHGGGAIVVSLAAAIQRPPLRTQLSDPESFLFGQTGRAAQPGNDTEEGQNAPEITAARAARTLNITLYLII